MNGSPDEDERPEFNKVVEKVRRRIDGSKKLRPDKGSETQGLPLAAAFCEFREEIKRNADLFIRDLYEEPLSPVEAIQRLQIEQSNPKVPVTKWGIRAGSSVYVIRNADLGLFESLGFILISLQALLSPVPGGALYSTAFSVFVLVKKAWSKGITLDEEDYRLLMILKRMGPSSLPEISSKMNGLSIALRPQWIDEKTEKALLKLSKRRGKDMTEIPLTVQTDGLWSLNGRI